MKKFLFIAVTALFLLVAAISGRAQNQSDKALGNITYTLYQKLLSGPSLVDNNDYNKTNYILYFGQNASVNCQEIPTAVFKEAILVTLNNDTLALNPKNIGQNKQLNKYYEDLEAEKKRHPPIPVLSYRSYKSDIYYTVNNNQRVSLSVVSTDTMPPIHWELQDSVKSISGYEVNEATTDYKGRHYTAWYAKTIPVPAGPWQLHGLPGLILEAEDSTHEIRFEFRSLDLDANQKVVIQRPSPNYTIASPQEYAEALTNKQKQMAKMAAAAAGDQAGAKLKNMPVYKMRTANLDLEKK